MECKFVVGQKVVCVAPACGWRTYCNGDWVKTPGPDEGQICRITEIAIDSGIVGLRLAEFADQRPYDHRCFRPLQDRPKEADTDISVFYPLLKTKTLEPVE